MEKKIILSDYQIKLLHSLLVNEEKSLSGRIPIIVMEHNYKIDKAMEYISQVKCLRRRFAELYDEEGETMTDKNKLREIHIAITEAIATIEDAEGLGNSDLDQLIHLMYLDLDKMEKKLFEILIAMNEI